ncbi:hypothetical protein V8B55DRAFT_1341249 [Mucor lusitanicus]|uniref:Uncharacterized protein n=2 Tax=Mucor circinelloides f. lusitanicus TaxID=29924 RepID=A0A168NLA9_MUCCL|nr:hypothetical protein FB192DRAFT_1449521 [Mucor lusitanicus]OAD06428.1 hypothetical protein MUCCIDRAFT_107005 [Mucor lusitanicus CBS 277.49]
MSLEKTVVPSFGPVVATPAGNTEQRPSGASTPTFGNGTGSPSSQSLSTDKALSKELDSQSVNAPGISGSDAMDLDPPASSFSATAQAPRNVDPQVRIDELTLAIDNHIVEVAVISDTVLLEQDDDARAKALHRMERLNQSIRSLVAIKDCLVSSLAATQRLATPSPAVPVLPSSVDGGQRSNSHHAPPVVPTTYLLFSGSAWTSFSREAMFFPVLILAFSSFRTSVVNQAHFWFLIPGS